MAYLLNWRMVLAGELLQQGKARVAGIAARDSYGSASAFSAARYSIG